MTQIVEKLAWMPVRNRAVLFARSKKEPALFYCVGGKREVGESDEQALLREAKEEAGVSLQPHTVQHVYTFEGPCHGYPEGTLLKMICYDAGYEGELLPSNEVAELAWFTSADTYRTTKLGQDILQWYKEQNLID